MFEAIVFGLIYGIHHSFEPDHVVTMSTIVSKSKSIWSTLKIGVFWALGHVITLYIVGISLIVVKKEIPENILIYIKILFALFLIYIGISALRNKSTHIHHEIDFHKMKLRSIFVGILHGLIGSTIMIFLVTSSDMKMLDSVLNVIGFGLGTFVGMVVFAVIIGLPFTLTTKNKNLNKYLSMFTGLLSILFGIYLLYGVVFDEILL